MGAPPRILAHRGASGHAEENSLAAFEAARKLGADGVELDVHASADGVLLVRHDAELPGTGSIASLPSASVRSWSGADSQPIPTLDEALGILGGMEVWIELKALPEAADNALFAAIDRAPSPELCRIHSFDHRIVARLGQKRPSLPRGVLSASYPMDPLEPLLATGAGTLWQEWRLIDRELVAALHGAGRSLVAWTVNDATVAQRLAALGVDALCGNYPERLRID